MATTGEALGSTIIKRIAGLTTSTMKSAFNMLNVATDGTQEATKFINTDSNTNQGIAKVTEIHIGTAGSETQVNATAAEINQAFDLSAKGEVLITTEALTNADNGKIFFLALNTGFTTTLPELSTVTSGWSCRFITQIAVSSNDYIITEHASDSTKIITNNIIELEVDNGENSPSNTGHATLTMPSGSSLNVIGDWLQFETNGTNWFVHGQTKLDGGVALS